jgi:hypothetical protein
MVPRPTAIADRPGGQQAKVCAGAHSRWAGAVRRKIIVFLLDAHEVACRVPDRLEAEPGLTMIGEAGTPRPALAAALKRTWMIDTGYPQHRPDRAGARRRARRGPPAGAV